MTKNKITAVLGPTNTGKTHLAIETLLSFDSGMIGFPLRLLAREVYDKVITKIGLDIERDLLYERINIRVDEMIEAGLINEVISLLPFKNHNALKTVGYKEIFAFHNGENNLAESIQLIKRNTRRLAKRRITWFKKDKKTKWFHPNSRKDIISFISKL